MTAPELPLDGMPVEGVVHGFHVERTAIISDDLRYRYRLGRRWDRGLGVVTWVMLNPSKADAEVDDRTIVACCAFARSWGAGAIDVVNQYAARATDPDEVVALHRAGYDVRGPDNAAHVIEAMTEADVIVAAWGATVRKIERAGARPLAVLTLARELGKPVHCLGVTKGTRDPRHPSRLAYSTPLVELR